MCGDITRIMRNSFFPIDFERIECAQGLGLGKERPQLGDRDVHAILNTR